MFKAFVNRLVAPGATAVSCPTRLTVVAACADLLLVEHVFMDDVAVGIISTTAARTGVAGVVPPHPGRQHPRRGGFACREHRAP